MHFKNYSIIKYHYKVNISEIIHLTKFVKPTSVRMHQCSTMSDSYDSAFLIPYVYNKTAFHPQTEQW